MDKDMIDFLNGGAAICDLVDELRKSGQLNGMKSAYSLIGLTKMRDANALNASRLMSAFAKVDVLDGAPTYVKPITQPQPTHTGTAVTN